MEDGWAELPRELVEKVLELLQAAGQAGGLGFSQASATVRLVCSGWKAVHDALVTRLMLSVHITDEAMGMLVRSFPAVVSLELKHGGYEEDVLTDESMRAVSSLTALTSLNLTNCRQVTDDGVRAVVADEGLRAVSCLRALTSLNLYHCDKVTDVGVRAVVSSCTAIKSLNLVTNEALRAVRSLPALTFLDLRGCGNVSAAGVQTLRSTTAALSLHIEWVKVTRLVVVVEDLDKDDAEEGRTGTSAAPL
jgi:bacterioferritin-associated ferredoxin